LPNLKAHMPRPVFQYTLDQIAMCLALDETYLRASLIHFDTVTAGTKPRGKMTAHNVADLGDKPDWRVTENEFIRWLRMRGYRKMFDTLY
jgi:hypothetical protein